jgi:hypothetical protein
MNNNKIVLGVTALFLSSLVFIFSILSILENWHEFKVACFYSADSFSKTEGIIKSVEIERGQVSLGRRGSPEIYYFPKIIYSFINDNVKYNSDKIAFAETRFKEYEDAREYLNRYQIGSKVVVYYDFDNPEISVLDPNRKGDYYGVLLGVLILPFGLLSMLLRSYLKQKRKPVDDLLAEKIDKLVDEGRS